MYFDWLSAVSRATFGEKAPHIFELRKSFRYFFLDSFWTIFWLNYSWRLEFICHLEIGMTSYLITYFDDREPNFQTARLWTRSAWVLWMLPAIFTRPYCDCHQDNFFLRFCEIAVIKTTDIITFPCLYTDNYFCLHRKAHNTTLRYLFLFISIVIKKIQSSFI